MEFEFPDKSIFSKDMPRYPNVWFYVDPELLNRGKYYEAVVFVVNSLEDYCGLTDDWGSTIRNHNLYHLLNKPSEGSDAHARSGPLQPYRDPANPERNHDHELHIRYYFSDLVRAGLESAELTIDGAKKSFYRVAASIHYEVASGDRLHPYDEFCPICGRFGEYDVEVDRSDLDKQICMKIHDPLGVELLLRGTIRGKDVLKGGKRVGFIGDMARDYDVRIYEVEPKREGMNTPKIGCVVISPKKFSRSPWEAVGPGEDRWKMERR
ncbi:MAG: hypothetical protein ACUVXI_14155 [bacterium]